jgi:multicomponent Na+:H+ antiporter subunit F
MTVLATISMGCLVLAAALCVIRLLRGRSISDRIVALDTLLVVIVSGIAVHAAVTGDGTNLAFLMVTALLGFVGTITVARFIERRGA